MSPRRWGRRTLGEEKVALTSAVGGLPLGAGARARRGDERAAGDGAVRQRAPRRRSRSVWSARTARAGSATAPSSPASAPSTPVTGCAGSTGGSRCAPETLHVVDLPQRGGQRRAARGGRAGRLRTLGRRRRRREQPRRDDAGGVGAGRALRAQRRPGRPAGGRRRAASTSAPAPASGTCARSWAGSPPCGRPACATTPPTGSQFRATAGTVVIVLSPMLSEAIGSATAAMHRRGLPVLVVDTLPDLAGALAPEGTDPQVADLAWRMRRTEREQFLAALAREGCPVVAVAGSRHPRRRAAPAGPPGLPAAGAGPMNIRWRDWSRGQWALRLLVVLGPVVALLAQWPSLGPPRPWLVGLTVGARRRLRAGARVGGRCGGAPRGRVLLGQRARAPAPARGAGRRRRAAGRRTSPRCWRRTGRRGCPARPAVARLWVRRGALLVCSAAPAVWLLALRVRGGCRTPGACGCWAWSWRCRWSRWPPPPARPRCRGSGE